MEVSYWQSRWQKGNIGWHMETVYPPLSNLWRRIGIKSDTRVLVPLCGKSLDLLWLADHCDTVTGVEISPKALQQVMQQHSESFVQDTRYGFTIYRSKSLVLWEADFAKLPADQIPSQNLIYDKASIVALPPAKRLAHAKKMIELCNPDTQILIQVFEYDQREMDGPPFSVDEQELKKLFGQRFKLKCIHEQSKLEELEKFKRRGLSSYLTEKIFHLTPLNSG